SEARRHLPDHRTLHNRPPALQPIATIGGRWPDAFARRDRGGGGPLPDTHGTRFAQPESQASGCHQGGVPPRGHHGRDHCRRQAPRPETIAPAKPGQDIPRRHLIEAYLQLGRAYSFAHESPPAEVWFRKMHDLAERWVSEDPTQVRAHDLLASSLRKLADLKKF